MTEELTSFDTQKKKFPEASYLSRTHRWRDKAQLAAGLSFFIGELCVFFFVFFSCK